MTIIIGLGNPGEKYKNTRHNVGFMALDKIAEINNFPEFKLSKKYSAEIAESNFGEQKVLLAKPQTFMNDSGKTALKLISNFKFQISNLIVIHDDIDLPVGKIKIAKDRGSAGHKGVESIIKYIGNDNLTRIRVGIGSRKNQEAMKVVLKKFTVSEQKFIDEVISETVGALELLITDGLEKAMSLYN